MNPDMELNAQAAQRAVSPDYFAAMGLRLVFVLLSTLLLKLVAARADDRLTTQ